MPYRQSILIDLEIDVELCPGLFYDPADFVKLVQRELDRYVPHYHPVANFKNAINLRLQKRKPEDI